MLCRSRADIAGLNTAVQKPTAVQKSREQSRSDGLRREHRGFSRISDKFKEAQQEHQSGSLRYLTRCRSLPVHDFSTTIHVQEQVAGPLSAHEHVQEG